MALRQREVWYLDGTWARERGERTGNYRYSEILRVAESKREKLRRTLSEKRAAMIKYIEELQAIADAMDKFHERAAIANVTSSSVSAAGGIMAIAGLALSPFTLGTSLLVSAVGAGVSIAGGVTRAASGVSEAVSNSIDKNDVEKILKSCSKDIKEVCAALEDYEKYILTEVKKEDQERLQHELESMWRVFFSFAGEYTDEEFKDDILLLVKELMRNVIFLITTLLDDIILAAAAGAARAGAKATAKATAKAAAKAAAKATANATAKAAAKAATKATGIAGAVFLPLDVYDIYKNAKEIQGGAKTEIASRIREIAAKIDSIINNEPPRAF